MTDLSNAIRKIVAVHKGLELIIGNLDLPDEVKEQVLEALKAAREAKGASEGEEGQVLWRDLSALALKAFTTEGSLPIEVAFAMDPQPICDALYNVCALLKVETVADNLKVLDKILQARLDEPHLDKLKALQGEVKALKTKNDRLHALLRGEKPVEPAKAEPMPEFLDLVDIGEK